ncbi:MAG: response regulator transcription factor [Spirochaetia bacterium]
MLSIIKEVVTEQRIRKLPKNERTELLQDIWVKNLQYGLALSVFLLFSNSFTLFQDIHLLVTDTWTEVPGYRNTMYFHAYTVIMAITVIVYFLIKRKKQGGKITSASPIPGYFLLCNGLLIGTAFAINAQMFHSQIIVYMVSLVTVSVVFLTRFRVMILFYSIFHLVFVSGLFLFQEDPLIRSINFNNATSFFGVSIIISRIMFYRFVSIFIQQKTIEKQALTLIEERKNKAFKHLTETAGMTKRETEIAGHLISGMSYNKIAEKLHISITTVKTHAHKIYTKANVKGRNELSGQILNASNTALKPAE